jgi:hypothetical protein
MTAVSNVQENRDGTHHGIKLEVNMSFPGGEFQPYEVTRPLLMRRGERRIGSELPKVEQLQGPQGRHDPVQQLVHPHRHRS